MDARNKEIWERSKKIFREVDETRNQSKETVARARRALRLMKAAQKRRKRRR